MKYPVAKVHSVMDNCPKPKNMLELIPKLSHDDKIYICAALWSYHRIDINEDQLPLVNRDRVLEALYDLAFPMTRVGLETCSRRILEQMGYSITEGLDYVQVQKTKHGGRTA